MLTFPLPREWRRKKRTRTYSGCGHGRNRNRSASCFVENLMNPRYMPMQLKAFGRNERNALVFTVLVHSFRNALRSLSTLSKSPVHVARMALAVATKALRPYAHKFSPKLFTQPQLFVCLVLKTFFKTDFCGMADIDQRVETVVSTRVRLGGVESEKSHGETFRSRLRPIWRRSDRDCSRPQQRGGVQGDATQNA